MCETRRPPRGRAAFTLIELLVVMTLILVIFALGVGYVVFGQDSQHSVTAAQAVTGAVLNSKQRARRDARPTGVRILFDPNTNLAAQLQFIQQPEDYNFGYCNGVLPPGSTSKQLTFSNGAGAGVTNATQVDFQGGANYIGEIDESTIQAGDYFTISGVPTPHRINQVLYTLDANNKLTVPTLNLDSPVTLAPGQPYAVIRGPRRLPSEDVVQLPPSIVIDGARCVNLPLRTLTDNPPNPAPPRSQNFAEILFAPSGGVIGQGTGADKIYLWLRDPSVPVTTGSPLILSVQIRTGFIGAFPVAPGVDPYLFAKDPRASGL